MRIENMITHSLGILTASPHYSSKKCMVTQKWTDNATKETAANHQLSKQQLKDYFSCCHRCYKTVPKTNSSKAFKKSSHTASFHLHT